MKLVQKYDWSANKLPYSISAAVERELDGTGYDQGQLEDLAATVANCRRFVGQLAERLFDNGNLSKEDVLALLSSYTEAET